jgi:uncharacterized OsmC-like protein
MMSREVVVRLATDTATCGISGVVDDDAAICNVEDAMTSDELVVNRVHSVSTSTPGRALNEVRNHQLVIDEPTHLGGPGEQITPAEAFLASVSACGVLLVQGRARDTGVRLDQVDATIEGVRHRSDTSVFQRIELRFRLSGPSQAQAIDLVDHYKRR